MPRSSDGEATGHTDLLGGPSTSLPTGFDDASQNNESFDYGTTDWTLLDTLGDPSLQFDMHNFDNAGFEIGSENMDSTVESFIAEFLQNDATWNPF